MSGQYTTAVAAAGAPDYFAHKPEEAPLLVLLAQRLGLMMSPQAHLYHHQFPSKGFAYFSPITNYVLDNTQLLHKIVEPAMSMTMQAPAVPVPSLVASKVTQCCKTAGSTSLLLPVVHCLHQLACNKASVIAQEVKRQHRAQRVLFLLACNADFEHIRWHIHILHMQ